MRALARSAARGSPTLQVLEFRDICSWAVMSGSGGKASRILKKLDPTRMSMKGVKSLGPATKRALSPLR